MDQHPAEDSVINSLARLTMKIGLKHIFNVDEIPESGSFRLELGTVV